MEVMLDIFLFIVYIKMVIHSKKYLIINHLK